MERNHLVTLLAALVLVLLAPVCSLHAQGVNNLWMGGLKMNPHLLGAGWTSTSFQEARK